MKNQVGYEIIKNDVMILKNLIDIKSGLVDVKMHQNMINEIDKSISILINSLHPLLLSINQSNDQLTEYSNLYDNKLIKDDLVSDKLQMNHVWVD